MNYSKNSINRQIRQSKSISGKVGNKIILIILKTLFIAFLIGAVLAVSMSIGLVMGVIDNTPQISMESVVPMGYATVVYNAEGQQTDTLVMAGSNRAEATYDEIPQDLVNAFVAIEDSRFWQHNGIDTRAILRAAKGVISGDSSSGGGSTITQQLIKNNVFNGGREKGFGAKLERKLQEQVLAIELEKSMDKELILQNYMNTINLGNNCLGVKIAAKRYFNKDLKDLTLSECTVIAGITQNPSKYNPISGREKNAEKRKVILQYMYEQGYITKQQQEDALADDVYDRIQLVDIVSRENINTYSYYTDELIDQVMETLIKELGYTETQAYNMLYSGGLSIYTAQDPAIQEIVDRQINDPENYVSASYSVEYRLTVRNKKGETSNYSEKSLAKYHKEVLKDKYNGLYENEEEARKDADQYREYLLSDGGEVLGESFAATVQPQVSFVIMDQLTGQVKAMAGGRGEKRTSLSLNRASDTLRQPGSTFKVLSAFAPAIDACGATLGTVYYDSPYTVGTKTFKNWYSSGYFGWCNIRDGIVYSMNIIAVRCLMETVTPQTGVEYCKKFGITSLTDTDYNPATALGGITRGVSNLEMTAAYAAIANDGIYTKPVMFTKIYDHNGKLLIDNTPQQEQVIKPSTSFLMKDAMKDSMLPKRIYSRGDVSISATSSGAHLENMTCAGKSGTTSNSNDIWFVGFTPYYTAGIWAGFDGNESTLSGQSSFHKQIWKKIMDEIHTDLPDPGFTKPDSVVTAQICRKSGKLAVPGLCDADPRGSAVYTEYFEEGTVPEEYCGHHTTVTLCEETQQTPGEYCPSLITAVRMIVPDADSAYETDDSIISLPPVCSVHTAENTPDSGSPFAPGFSYGPGYVKPERNPSGEFLKPNMTGPGGNTVETAPAPPFLTP